MALTFPAPLDTLSEDEGLILAGYITNHTFPAGSCIFTGGSDGDCCYIIDAGLVRIEISGEQHVDDDQVLDFVEPGEILGELSLLDREPRSASAWAHYDVVARRLDSAALEELTHSHPYLAIKLVSALGRSASSKLRQQAARLDRLLHDQRDPIVDGMIERAISAQRELQGWSEARLDALLQALAQGVALQAQELAAATVAETKIGNVPDKTAKNTIASLGVYRALAEQAGHGPISFDEHRQVMELASPVGVVFGLIPVTNPVATFIFKTLVCLKGRNAVILSPSRLAQRVSNQTGTLIQSILQEHGAPLDAVQWISARNSRKMTTSFMKHPKVAMILATGGPALVKAAYSSGNPAIGVGSGNAPAFICHDADPQQAAMCVVASKTFDNGLICGSEHNLVVVEAIRTAFLAALEQQGAAVLTADEMDAFSEAALDLAHNKLSSRVTGRFAAEIADKAQIKRDYPIKLLVVPTEGVSARNPLASEKMAPILSLFTVADEEVGMQVCEDLLAIDGMGHTAIIHSQNADLIQRFGMVMPASRILVNSPGSQGVVGATTGLVPSFTLGCGTFGGTSTTDNVTYTHLLNIKRIAYYNPQLMDALNDQPA